MILDLDRLKDRPFVLHFEETAGLFPLLASMQGNGVSFAGPISGDVTAVYEYGNVRVTGRLTAPLSLACSRCLTEYDSYVDTNFTLLYRKEEQAVHGTGDDLELHEEDLLSLTYSGGEIDLTHEIEEQIALEIPLKPLCHETCLGLCHQCGTDLNHSQCSCSTADVNLKFSALKNFKINR